MNTETLQEMLARRNIRLVLASASPRRRELMHQAELFPEILPSHKEERSRAKTPAALVKALSGTKAGDIAAQLCAGAEAADGAEHQAEKADGSFLVVGADTIVVHDGLVLGKPKDPEDAVRMLRELSGRTHHVYTGVTLILGGAAGQLRKVSFYEKTAVQVYPLTEAEIRAYVSSGDPLDKAGAYGIQGAFGQHIRGIRGDYTNVVGLPLGRTVWEMKKLLTEESE